MLSGLSMVQGWRNNNDNDDDSLLDMAGNSYTMVTPELESFKKMLRSVLLPSKEGVPVNKIEGEFMPPTSFSLSEDALESAFYIKYLT